MSPYKTEKFVNLNALIDRLDKSYCFKYIVIITLNKGH